MPPDQPSRDLIERALRGDLPEEDLERVLAHCEERPDQLVAIGEVTDPLIAAVRDTPTVRDELTHVETEVLPLVQRIIEPGFGSGEAGTSFEREHSEATIIGPADAATIDGGTAESSVGVTSPAAVPPVESAATSGPSVALEPVREPAFPGGSQPTQRDSHLATPVESELVPGLVLGAYKIIRKLGQGGMGMVFLAEHQRMKRLVALKVLPPQLTRQPAAIRRFQREVQALARLSHPNIVTAFDADEARGLHLLVMEYVDGTDLSVLVKKQGPLPVDKAVDYITQAARGLEYAHKRGMVHRDIKPSNILVDTEGQVKILDLGLARFGDSADAEGQELTGSGMLLGTADYMAPEQAENTKAADARADIYSLGCTLYYLLTGRTLYTGDTVLARLLAHTKQPIPSLRAIIPTLPPELDAVYQRAVAKSPDERFQTVSEFLAALGRVPADSAALTIGTISLGGPSSADARTQAGDSPVARPATSSAGRGSRTRVRTMALAAGGAALLFLAVWIIIKDQFNNEVARIEVKPEQTINVQGSPGTTLSVVNTPEGGRATTQHQENGWHGWPAAAPKPAIAPFDAAQAKAHQEAWAAYLNVPVEYTNSIGMKFRLIPPGQFTMGSTPEEIAATIAVIEGDDNGWKDRVRSEGPTFPATLTRPFYLAVNEVTQAEYEKLVGKNPAHFSATGAGRKLVKDLDTHQHPVEVVSWNEAIEFCRKVATADQITSATPPAGEPTGRGWDGPYSLPTEAEWEFAARAGTLGSHWTGPDPAALRRAAWYLDHGADRSHPVGQLEANPFGLCDVYGNVWEWVLDGYEQNHFQKLVGGVIDPVGPVPPGTQRVLKGGAMGLHALHCRSNNRGAVPAHMRADGWGFRLALSVDAVRGKLRQLNETPALAFDGTGAHVEVPDLRWDPAKPLTLEAWCLPAKPNTNGLVAGFAGECELRLRGRHWWFGVKDKNGSWREVEGTSDASYKVPAHIAGVWNGAEIRLFVDGVRHREAVPCQVPSTKGVAATFGAAADRTQPYTGRLLQARISTAARYVDDFDPAPDLGTDAETALLYHFKMDTGETVSDLSGNNRTGTLRGAKWTSAPRVPGSAVNGASPGVGSSIDNPGARLKAYLDANRRAAERALALGGEGALVEVQPVDKFVLISVQPGGPLPNEPFVVRRWSIRNSTTATNADLDVLTPLRHARVISLYTLGRLDNDAITRVAAMRSPLEEFAIPHSGIKTSSFETLPVLPGVFHLDVTSPQVDDDWRSLHKFPNLTTVTIFGDPLPNLEPLTAMPGLRHLMISGAPAPADEVVLRWQERNPRLRISFDQNADGKTERLLGVDPARAAAKRLQAAGCSIRITEYDGTIRELVPAEGDRFVARDLWCERIPADLVWTDTLSNDLSQASLLNLSGAGVKQADVLAAALGHRHELQNLILANSDLTDTGLKQLEPLTGLAGIDLTGTRVTAAGIAAFHRAVPACHIGHESFSTPPDFLADPISTALGANAPPAAIAPFDAVQAKAHQEAWAAYLNVPVEYTNSIGMKFRLIPPGEFMMGSPQEEIDEALKQIDPNEMQWAECIRSEAPQHKVILTQPIYVGVHEVTQAEYERVMGKNPSHFSPGGSGKALVAGLDSARFPVENMSWNDAAEFCAKLSQQENRKPFYVREGESITPLDGTGYRLPSEAEWEFACRAGTTSRFWSGDTENDLLRTDWFRSNAGGRLHAVGELPANPFGLVDLHGNVWERVQDCWDPNFYQQFVDKPAIDPVSTCPSGKNPERVTRGGRFFPNTVALCRSSSRFASVQRHFREDIGFRLVLPVSAVKSRGVDPAPPEDESRTSWHGWPVDAPKPAIAPFGAAQAKRHQEEWAAYLKQPVEFRNDIGITFRLIPPGEFLMGSPDSDTLARPVEKPQQKVTLTIPFYLAVHELTREQFAKFVAATNHLTDAERSGQGGLSVDLATGKPKRDPQVNWKNPGFPQKDTHPVVNVSWNDAIAFCAWQGEGRYRLPTEAEWEFACRAGTTTLFHMGDNAEQMVEYGNVQDSAYKDVFGAGELDVNVRDGYVFTAPVGSFRPNPFGLHDVIGNVWEWCADHGLRAYSREAIIDPIERQATSQRISRGGAMECWRVHSRSSVRNYVSSDHAAANQGIRIALSIDVGRFFPAAPPVSSTRRGWPADASRPTIARLGAARAKSHLEARATVLTVPAGQTRFLGMKLPVIHPDEFTMGSGQARINATISTGAADDKSRTDRVRSEGLRQSVTITRPSYPPVNEVTR